MPIACPACQSSDLSGVLEGDGRIQTVCEACGHEWMRGEAKKVYKSTRTIEDLRRYFPSPADVKPDALSRLEKLKGEFLEQRPEPRPEVAPFWQKYQEVFSEAGLATCDPQDLKDFANSSVGANPGNMSVFNTAWNEMGSQEGAARTRDAIQYLLYGPEGTYLEDRLTHLIDGGNDVGMVGFREALLTKVRCVVEPDRYLPIVKYTGVAGKKEIAQAVFDLRLPEPENVSWTIGRLVLWSNDLLRDLVGSGFADMAHAASFLWWAKDRTGAASN